MSINTEKKEEKIKNPVGRPRQYDRAEMGRKMIEWINSDPENINLCGFCADYGFPSEKVFLWEKEDEEFRKSYLIAKDLIARKREKLLNQGKLHSLAYVKNVNAYDSF